MDPNALLVSVLAARGMYLKGHAEMDALVTVTMHGKGNLRSRAVTETVHNSGDCQWNEHMEFKVSDMTASLTVCAQHKSRLGRNDVIGRVELPLDQARGIRGEQWFPLRKKSGEDKYRGEVQLRFEFRYEKPTLSISNQSLNTIGKDSMMDKLKGKIKLGKLRHKNDPDSLSIASGVSAISGVSAMSKVSKGGTLSRLLGRRKSKQHDEDTISQTFSGSGGDEQRRSPMPTTMSNSLLEPPGQSNPPVAFQRSGSRRFNQGAVRQSTPSLQQLSSASAVVPPPSSVSSADDQPPRRPKQHFQNSSSSAASLNGVLPLSLSTHFNNEPPVPPSPILDHSGISTAESIGYGRPPSVASSGFGSNHRNQNGSDDNGDASRDDLLARIDKLEMELRVKDSRMRDMEDYLDGLLSRVMERCPDVLANPTANGAPSSLKANRRFYSTIGF